MNAFNTLHPHELQGKFLQHGVRVDGRTLLQCRNVSVAPGPIEDGMHDLFFCFLIEEM